MTEAGDQSICYNLRVDEDRSEGARDKARWTEERLTQFYGPRPYDPEVYDDDLVGALVATVLSQHTSDLNSGRAYASLKSAFPAGWDSVREAQVERIAEAIRQGGLANVKAARIKQLLQDIYTCNGETGLECLRAMTDAEAMTFLTGFQGVGPKTAACVLMFNLGRSVVPVDTHVHRVALRLGLAPANAAAPAAQDILCDLAPENLAYSFHVHLIEHGRQICHARRPECGRCPLSDRCDYFHERSFAAAGAASPG